jgi:zinc protease
MKYQTDAAFGPRPILRWGALLGAASALAVATVGLAVAAAALTGVAGALSEAAAQEQQSLSEPVPFDPQATVGTLSNGLIYYIRQNSRPENRAELRLVVNAGSVLEDEDQRGLAHFLEHMAFNGTENFEKQELVNYLESIGMRFGPNINAFTSFDETVYMLRVPTDDPDILATGFQILEDWSHGVAFDPEEVEKERGVVIEEWRLGRGAMARIRDQQLPILFQGSLYAERLPIGDRETLESFEHEALKAFYRTWYRPDLMAVVAVGDFQAADIEALIRKHFQGLEASASPAPRPRVEVPVDHPTLFALASDPEVPNTQVGVIYKRPARQVRTLAAFRQRLVEDLYSSMFNRRLFELTQQAEPPFLSGGVGLGRFARALETYQLFALVEDGGIETGLEALLTEAERVSRHGFTQSELERERRELLRALESRYAEREQQESARYAGEYMTHFLYGSPSPGIEAELEITREFLPGIGLEEINRLADEEISDEGRVVLVSAPSKEGSELPGEDQLLAVFTAVEGKEISPYEDVATGTTLVSEPPAPSPVVSERTIEEIDLTVWELGNGVRVLLKPTDFKADEILVRAYSPGGTSLVADEDLLPASTADVVVARGGVGDLSLVDLDKFMAGKVAQLSPYISPLTEGLSGEASPQDLETLFQLAYLYFTAPRKDSTAFLAYRALLEGLLENRDADPRAAFQDTLSITLAQGHPRVRPFTMERLEELDLEESFDFYRDRFADASDFTFILVGSFEPKTLRPLVETWLGGLPSLRREESWRDVGIDPPTGVVRKEVRKGIEPQSRTRLVFAGPAIYSVEEDHVLETLASILDIRLRERLREDLGGTYGVSVSASLQGDPDPEYAFRIGFGSDPARVQELVGVVFQELEAFRLEGPTEEEVQKVRESQRRAKETNLRENRYWAGQLSALDRYGLDLTLVESYELIEGWSAEQVREASVRYLSPDHYVQVSLFPEERVR